MPIFTGNKNSDIVKSNALETNHVKNDMLSLDSFSSSEDLAACPQNESKSKNKSGKLKSFFTSLTNRKKGLQKKDYTINKKSMMQMDKFYTELNLDEMHHLTKNNIKNKNEPIFLDEAERIGNEWKSVKILSTMESLSLQCEKLKLLAQ